MVVSWLCSWVGPSPSLSMDLRQIALSKEHIKHCTNKPRAVGWVLLVLVKSLSFSLWVSCSAAVHWHPTAGTCNYSVCTWIVAVSVYCPDQSRVGQFVFSPLMVVAAGSSYRDCTLLGTVNFWAVTVIRVCVKVVCTCMCTCAYWCLECMWMLWGMCSLK